MKRLFSRWVRFALLSAGLFPLLASAAAPCVVLPDGRKVEGTEVTSTREGVIYLTTSAGRVEYPKGTKVVMDEPQDLKQASALIQKKQYDEAIPMLEKVVEKCRFLGWDRKARILMASANNGKRNWKSAVDGFEAVMADFPDSKDDEAVRSGYLQALSGNGDTNKALPLLAMAIAKAPRAEAAQAQMIRARAALDAGDVEGALYDFMRTSRYFRDSKDLAAEATYWTAECLEKLGDAERAGQFYRQVVDYYPDSTYAGQAKVKAGVAP